MGETIALVDFPTIAFVFLFSGACALDAVCST
jgi:hypothetical protein